MSGGTKLLDKLGLVKVIVYITLGDRKKYVSFRRTAPSLGMSGFD